MRHKEQWYPSVSWTWLSKWIPIYNPLLYLNYFSKWAKIGVLTTWDIRNNNILAFREIKFSNESQYTNLYFTLIISQNEVELDTGFHDTHGYQYFLCLTISRIQFKPTI